MEKTLALAFCLSCASFMYWATYFLFGCSVGSNLGGGNVCWVFENLYFYKISGLLLLQHGCFFALGIFMWIIKEYGICITYIIGFIFTLCACIFQLIWTASYYSWKEGLSGASSNPCLLLSIWGMVMILLAASIFFREHIYDQLRAHAGVIRTIGNATYPLYLCHGFVGGLIMAMMLKLGVNGIYGFAVALGVTTMVSVAIAEKLEPMLRNASDRYFLRLRPDLQVDCFRGSNHIIPPR